MVQYLCDGEYGPIFVMKDLTQDLCGGGYCSRSL